MLPEIFSLKDSKAWIYILFKLALTTAFSILLLALYPRTVGTFDSVKDVVIPVIVSIITIAIVATMTFIKSIKRYTPLVVLVADLALLFAYMYFLPSPANLNYLLPMGMTLVIAISSIMYLGALFGSASAIGMLLVVGAAFAIRQDTSLADVFISPLAIYPVLFFIVTLLVIIVVWHAAIDEENSKTRKQVREEIETSRTRLQNMQDRTAALAEMATSINASLHYDRILDASLDLGRMSVRDNDSARVVSMALMVTSDDGKLTIEASRGLQHTDIHHTFLGERGVIAEAMEKGEAIIYDGGGDDPELKSVNSFALVKSTLVIPLRANFETYGVLVFGSTARNAINDDHFDTLATIGVQATVALQNAVLYNNLREEKERILRIEENGRKSLVRDLHDIPTQTVSAVAMHLSTIPTIAKRYPERLESEIQNIRSMALRATEELRLVMFTIRPLSLEANGLNSALTQLAEKMDKTYKQAMLVRLDPRIEDLLDKDAKGSLFYLVEEAANNARKYAQAEAIQVSGFVQENEVIIRVRDNGKGFNTAEVGSNYENRGSFGMVNMRERAELINGTFELQSAPSKGTTVTVRVPVQTSDPERKTPILKPRRPARKEYSGPLSPSA